MRKQKRIKRDGDSIESHHALELVMDKDFIAGLIALVENAAIAELEFSQGDERIRIMGRQAGANISPPVVIFGEVDEAPPANDAPKAHAVVAGMAGLFYRSPSPGAPSFVAVGDIVAEGQTLALLEAMKMLTPVEADIAGEITGIEAEDGATVERGARLFTISPQG